MDAKRLALVVANDQYDDPGLRQLLAPAHDAAALAEVLADPAVGGFDVQVLRNASAQEIRFGVEDFFADRGPEDLLLLHFSCHGLKNAAGELFLAVADTRPTRLASTAVAADFVNRQMADSRAQRIALFLDCCYGGAFPRGMVVRAAGEAQVRDAFAGQADVGGGRGRVVITASSAMEYAFEGGRLATDATPAPSVFTGAVVDGLTTGEADRDGDGWVGLTELVGYVTDRVRRVTPNQNPQMWTFGSQGELLIARSRVRRITPTPLAPELTQAMESPLPAARFGVVDYLRERLSGDDLGQAYAAWRALQAMVGDDSRKVSEAAQDAVARAALRISPPGVVELVGTSTAELQLAGPPLALTAAASSDVDWLKVEQDGRTIRLRAVESPPGVHETEVQITGPIGDHNIPVRLTVAAPRPAEPRPTPQPAARPAPQPVAQPAPQPVQEPAPQPQAAPPVSPAPVFVTTIPPKSATPPPEAPPWWLLAVLLLGGILLIALNWPGAPQSHKLWYDSNTDWLVYRSWGDPMILSSLGVLIAALVARSAGPIALGIATGCAAAVLETGILVLGGGIYYDGANRWAGATTVAAGLLVVLLIALRPWKPALSPVHPVPAVLVVAGGLLLLASQLVTDSDDIAFVDVTPLAILGPLVTVALGWLATAGPAPLWVRAAATTYAIISTVAYVPALTEGDAPAVFVTALAGNALVVAGVLSRGLRPPSRP
ncbi:caspase, EACC1-associated type [Kribbella shirazensis]|uniref:Peptidase C14 caspase domain-containing protein n=1 Tax=Kribbella shirazensis TaxID=1105143 RepID=A0A7X5VBA5_9ACTN|nr:caspase family protein [Kribbella shirazensis]NIK58065.1 hypothetical protein [Kribbella shirazensis]